MSQLLARGQPLAGVYSLLRQQGAETTTPERLQASLLGLAGGTADDEELTTEIAVDDMSRLA